MYRIRTLLLSAIALLLSVAAMAQPSVGTFSIIPRVGVSLSNLPGDKIMVPDADMPFSARYKAGFMGGVDLDYQFMRNLSVSLGAYYAQQGCRYENNTIEYDATGNTVKSLGYSDWSTQLHYLNVPLMLNAYIGPGFALKFGVQAGFALSGNMKYTSMEYERNADGQFVYGKPEKHDYDLDNSLRNVCISIPVGVSYEFCNVIIDGRCNIPLGCGFKSDSAWDSKNMCFTFSAAYRFEL